MIRRSNVFTDTNPESHVISSSLVNARTATVASMPTTTAGASDPSHVANAGNAEAVFRYWRYNIPQEIGTPTPLGPNLGRFLKQASELIDSDAGRMQEVIVLLASEGGVQRIIELLEQPLDKVHPDILARLFNSQIIYFLETSSYNNLQYCMECRR
ncbi:hypothetical protein KC365_g97 [Hortaea werneckii]|nr:hypothetical protein KC339_g92 [Hortaea werneckii]KAI7245891.1 hypothetical protein KC365_g97 [Hortaea werneckii]